MKIGVTFSLLLATTAIGAADDFDTWDKASPDHSLHAIERRIADPDAPSRLDLDGFAIFVCRVNSGYGSVVTPGAVIARHDFSGRLVSQIRWSPDSKFLLFTTASSGGHSPWRFKTFVFCVADTSFRNVEDAVIGNVIASQFHFRPPDVAVLTVRDMAAPEQNGDMIPKRLELPLGKTMEQMKRLP